MWIDETSKGLGHAGDSGPSVFVIDGFRHELLDPLIGETREIPEKDAVSS